MATRRPLVLVAGDKRELPAGDILAGTDDKLPNSGNNTYLGASLTIANSSGAVTFKVDASSSGSGNTANYVVARNGTAGEATYSWMTSGQKKWEAGLGAADTTDNLSIFYFDASNVRQLFATFARSNGMATFTKTSAFRAHRNGTAQSIPSGAFTMITFTTEAFDLNSDFASSTWTPPAGRPVIMEGRAGWGGPPGAGLIVIYKNGSIFAYGNRVDGIGGQPTIVVTAIDNPSGTDTYDLRVFQNSGAALNVLGPPESTSFSGARL